VLSSLDPRSARALLAPSARILVAASQPDCGVSRAAELPWADVHWATLVSLAQFERAECQLHRLMSSAPAGAIPDDVRRTLQNLSRVAAFRSAELADAAAAACDALSEAGIPVLWLKGAALAMQHADGFAVRGMGDLDVLVRPELLARAQAALLGVGWASGGSDDGYRGHHHAAPMLWRGGLRLELHTAVLPPGNPFVDDGADRWLRRGQSVQWGARAVQVLPGPWHLVHACVHWSWSHEAEVGTWQFLHDAQVLTAGWSAGGAEWREVSANAAELGGGRPVGWGLWSAAVLGGVAVPEATVRALRVGSGLRHGFVERMWVVRAFRSPLASPSVRWTRYWWRQAMGGLGDASSAWPWRAGRRARQEGLRGNDDGLIVRADFRSVVRGWRRHLAHLLCN
jgi:hypothetical protein